MCDISRGVNYSQSIISVFNAMFDNKKTLLRILIISIIFTAIDFVDTREALLFITSSINYDNRSVKTVGN